MRWRFLPLIPVIVLSNKDTAVVSLTSSSTSALVDSSTFHSQTPTQAYRSAALTNRRSRAGIGRYVTTATSMEWMTSWWGGTGMSKPDENMDRPMDTRNMKQSNTNFKQKNLVKKVTFVRHGCTYMNEYLAGNDGGKGFTSPDFTDIFVTPEQQRKYHDTPLSPMGQEQAKTLGSYPVPPKFTEQADLIVVSPLTRALQTFDIGIKPYLPVSVVTEYKNYYIPTMQSAIPIIAVPEAAERLYFISDVGRPISQLQKEFPYVDFTFSSDSSTAEAPWWYQPPNDGSSYEEWRPTDQQQKYACPSEPYDAFNERMSRLYYWLHNRSEMNIIVVCHHGVIDWMLDISFANCQYKQLPFAAIKPRTLIKTVVIEQPQQPTIQSEARL